MSYQEHWRIQEPDYRSGYDPHLRTAAPQRPEGQTRNQKRKWFNLTADERWNMGQHRFWQMLEADEGNNGMANFAWNHPTHDLTLRYIYEEVIGMEDERGRETGGYKKLRGVRSLLQLGSHARSENTATGQDTYYAFSSIEVAQLIIGFLAETA